MVHHPPIANKTVKIVFKPGFCKALAVSISGPLVIAVSTAYATEPFDLRYSVIEGCPSRDSFVQSVLDRTTRLPTPDPLRHVYTVTVDPNRDGVGNGVRARLVIDDGHGTPSSREVTARACDQALSALAFVAALSLDPNASAASSSEASSAHQWVDELPQANHVSPSTPGTFNPLSHPISWSAGLDAVVASANAPSLAWGGALFVEALDEAPNGLTPSHREFFFVAPTVRLSGIIVQSPMMSIDGASASFQVLTARLDGCPARLRMGPTLEAFACVAVELGILRGKGSGVIQPASAAERWTALDAGIRVRWLAYAPFFLEAQGFGNMPLTTPTFVFQMPRRVIYSVPHGGVTADMGLGVHFL